MIVPTDPATTMDMRTRIALELCAGLLAKEMIRSGADQNYQLDTNMAQKLINDAWNMADRFIVKGNQ